MTAQWPGLRTMIEADFDAVVQIEISVQENPWSRSTFMDCLKNDYACLVAEPDGLITGLGIMMISDRQAELLNIGVAAEYQRKGIGTCLLDRLLEHCTAKGVDEVFLEVRFGNLPAIDLYRKSGFREVGRRSAYYRAGPGPGGREPARIFKRTSALST